LTIQNIIIEQNGNCTVNELANDLNRTSRTIHRIFMDNIGIGPKDYMKIIRFNHACKLISTYSETDWFDIICSCGYHDQMHFIHEFKSVMKCTPKRFLKMGESDTYFNKRVVVM